MAPPYLSAVAWPIKGFGELGFLILGCRTQQFVEFWIESLHRALGKRLRILSFQVQFSMRQGLTVQRVKLGLGFTVSI